MVASAIANIHLIIIFDKSLDNRRICPAACRGEPIVNFSFL